MDRFKNLAKNTLIITIGKLSTQLITFLLLPLYTAILASEEFGAVDLITTIVQLLVPIVSLMIDQSIFRSLITNTNKKDIQKDITSSFVVLSIANIIFLVVFCIISLFVESNYKIWVLLIIIITTYSNLFLQISRGLKKTSDYAIASFVCSSSIIVLNVICLVALKTGAIGMIISIFLGNLFCCLYLFYKLRIYQFISLKDFSKKEALQQIKYSIPLIPNQLSLWIMNSSDRIIVTIFLGISSNGILAVTHKFPSIFATFYNVFLSAWHESGTIHYFDEDRDDFFSKTFDIVLSVFSTLCILIIAGLPLIFKLLVNNAYFESYYNVPIYMIGFLFNVIIGLLGVIYVATKNTFEIAKTTIISAILNIIINICLINKLGLYAASISTLISYFIAMVYRIISTKKCIKIKYNYRKIFFYTILLTISIITYYVNINYISAINLAVLFPMLILLNKKFILSFASIIKERRNPNENSIKK